MKKHSNNKELSHFGILGMRWGVRNSRSSPMDHFKRSVKQKYGKPKGGIPGAAGQAAAKAILGKNWKNKKTVKNIDDKIGEAFGMKKNKAGKWIVTPEATMKAAAAGAVLGFTVSFAEWKIRDFVQSRGVESLAQSAEYAKWLANG